MLDGVFTALITPFLKGEIDFPSLEKLIRQQISGGINGLVLCGTTGESPTLDEEEKLKILDFAVHKLESLSLKTEPNSEKDSSSQLKNHGKNPGETEKTFLKTESFDNIDLKKQIHLIFGSGSNSTKKTIHLSQKASRYPVSALLLVVPYYNKPPQKGLLKHFTAVADSVDKPVILYNVPSRTGVGLKPETIIELSKHDNIIGIKEANPNLDHFLQYKDRVPGDFCLLSGDDPGCVEFCLSGGHGVISVCSHLAPRQMIQWIRQAVNRDPRVKEDFSKQHPWIEKLYIKSNPIPIKSALKNQGLIRSQELRSPLVPLEDEMEKELWRVMDQYKGVFDKQTDPV